MELQNKRIITVATTGSWPRKKDNPYLPTTPEEIADDIYRCYLAGAAMAHIHVRDEEENPSMKTEYFERVFQRVRTQYPDCDIILNFTTSGGTSWSEEQRMEPALKLRPEMASYDCGSMNWQHRSVFNNNTPFLMKLGETLQNAGIKPEVEIFNSGMINEAKWLIREGALKPPVHFQFCMGVPGGAEATVRELMLLKDSLPEGSTWSAFGVGRGAMEILYSAIVLGGHVRVGMEDNIRYNKERLAEGNAELVKRAKQAIEMYGLEAATPAQARIILGLTKQVSKEE